MFAKRLFGQIYFACLLASLTALVIGAWYKADIQKDKFISGVVADLSARAERVAVSARPLFIKSKNNLSNAPCLVLGQNESAIITLVKPSGKVFCDSKEDPARLGNYSNKPEIQEANLGKVGFSFRKEK